MGGIKMDTTAAKLTVFFAEPFWVGVYERTESGQVEACRVVFGAEPKDYEVYDFLLKHWDSMRFSPPVAAEGIPSQIRNPKRARRAAKQALCHTGTGTKSQQKCIAGSGGRFFRCCGSVYGRYEEERHRKPLVPNTSPWQGRGGVFFCSFYKRYAARHVFRQ